MARENKLDEEYRELDKKEVADQKKDIEKKIKDKKDLLLKYRISKLKNDFVYVFLVSIILGFILFVWFPSMFGYFRSLALGLVWFLLFEELHLHKMFKKE